MKWTRNVSERAISTLWQTFAASLPTTFVLTGIAGDDVNALAALGLSVANGVIASLLSAAKNLTAEGVLAEAEKRVGMTTAAAQRITRPESGGVA